MKQKFIYALIGVLGVIFIIFGITLLKKPPKVEEKKEIKIVDIDTKKTPENKLEEKLQKTEDKKFYEKASKKELEESIYSSKDKEKIPNDTVEKIKSDVNMLKAKGKYNEALNEILARGKEYNSSSSKNFKDNLANQINDLSLLDNIPEICHSGNLEDIRTYVEDIKNNDNFILSILDLPEFIRVFVTDDLNSNSIMNYRDRPTVWIKDEVKDNDLIISNISINDEDFKAIHKKVDGKNTFIGFYKEGYPKVSDRRKHFELMRKEMDFGESTSSIRKMEDSEWIRRMFLLEKEEETNEIEETNADFKGDGIVSPRDSVYDESENKENN